MSAFLPWLMGLMDNLRGFLGWGGQRLDMEELARRLGITSDVLHQIQPHYQRYKIPKRSGGFREIMAPVPPLKEIQRKILRRVLSRLKSHPHARAYEKNHSIVTHALPHVRKRVVLQLDLEDFFTSTREDRIAQYFRKIGWNKEASAALTRICTYRGGLPQGAPTSPRLSNLVNYRMDERLTQLGKHFHAAYTRYADDIAFSSNDLASPHAFLRVTKLILEDEGYRMHEDKKLRIRRSHQRQLVTGLVVNEKIALPRDKRRWLRSVEHHLRQRKRASLTPRQLQGWNSFQGMIRCAQEGG